MPERKLFRITPEEVSTLLKACEPVPYIAIHCGNPRSQQENANAAWEALGTKLGFDHMSVLPTEPYDIHTFTAITKEPINANETQNQA